MAHSDQRGFVMQGAREAMARGLWHIREAVEGIERAVVETPGLAFDFAKSLIESACRTVLEERGLQYSEDDDLPKLFRTVSQYLSLLPPGAAGAADARRSMKKTLGGLSGTIQGICELRNQLGLASHGAGGPRPAMESVQALLVAQAADTIVGFLYAVHRDGQAGLKASPSTFDHNSDFNESVDEAFGSIEVFDVAFRPSEVLYSMEPESYRIYLAEFRLEREAEDAASGIAEQ